MTRFRMLVAVLTASVFVTAQAQASGILLDNAVLQANLDAGTLSSFGCGVAWDGTYYWSGEAGTPSGNTLNQHDASGLLVAAFQTGVDHRSVFTDASNSLYATDFGGGGIQVYQYTNGVPTLLYNLASTPDLQMEFGLRTSNNTLYGHVNGTIHAFNFADGSSAGTFTLSGYNEVYPANAQLAVVGEVLLTYDALGNVDAWDFSGNNLGTCAVGLAASGQTFSFSFANGLLWIETGTNAVWNGYDIGLALQPTPPAINSIVDVANDQGRWVRINFAGSSLDAAPSGDASGARTPITRPVPSAPRPPALRAPESSNTPPVASSNAAPPVAAPSASVGTNLILNGDFENTTFTPGCNFNLPNANVTAGLANITAFGAAQEIDVMNDGTSCGFAGPPQSGNVKLAIHRQAVAGATDEFSFELSQTVVSGSAYTIAFYAWANLSSDPDIGAVEIGLSSSATSFGTQVFSGTPTATAWTLLTGTFIAPVNATHLTVRVTASAEAWNHIDNFSLVGGATILQYEAFRRIDPLPSLAAGEPGDGQEARERYNVRPKGQIRGQMLSDAGILIDGWEFVGAIPAHGEATYNMIAPTLADSTITAGQHWSVFFIRAATEDPVVFFDSPPDSGYSVDNLAPGPPLNLVLGGSGVLGWDPAPEPDFKYFTVYGSPSAFFDQYAVLIGHTVDNSMNVQAQPYTFYYVTATDFSGNEGDPGTLSTATGIPDAPVIRSLSLRAHPNPFNPATTITYTVPKAGPVSIAVYDVNGRLVEVLLDKEYREANEYHLRYSPSGATGVYFVQIVTGAKTERLKIVLLK